jgi:rubrerythrin
VEIKMQGENIVISDFDTVEVFKLAMKIEMDGHDFYTAAMEKATDERMKRTFKRLAEDELRHHELFKSFWEAEVRGRGIDPSSANTEENMFTYMKTGIFTISPAKSAKEAVLNGEHAEIRSILFYKEMLKNTTTDSGKKALSTIIEEEQMHYNILKSWEAAV